MGRTSGDARSFEPGEAIHWPDLDEDISVLGLLSGKRRKRQVA